MIKARSESEKFNRDSSLDGKNNPERKFATQPTIGPQDNLLTLNKRLNLNSKEQQIKSLELWIMNEGTASLNLNESDFMQSFLKEDDNVDIFLSFFMDPFKYLSNKKVLA